MSGLIAGIVALVLCVPCAIAKAYVFTILWRWFVVEQFGFPALSLLQGWGLAIVFGYWLPQQPIKDKKTTREMWTQVACMVLVPWMVLGFSWVAHSFMVS